MTASFNLHPATCSLPVFAAWQWDVVSGVNDGDTLGPLDNVVLGDCYRLSPLARHQMLELEPAAGRNTYRIATSSEAGAANAIVRYAATLIFMTDDGAILEGVVLREFCGLAAPVRYHFVALSCRIESRPHCLIDVRRDPSSVAFAKATSVFAPTDTATDAPFRPLLGVSPPQSD